MQVYPLPYTLPNHEHHSRGPVPTSDTDLVTKTIFVDQITVTNGTAGTITFTVKDKQSTARAVIDANNIDAGETVTFDLGFVKCENGISWSASGAGLTASVRGLRAA